LLWSLDSNGISQLISQCTFRVRETIQLWLLGFKESPEYQNYQLDNQQCSNYNKNWIPYDILLEEICFGGNTRPKISLQKLSWVIWRQNLPFCTVYYCFMNNIRVSPINTCLNYIINLRVFYWCSVLSK